MLFAQFVESNVPSDEIRRAAAEVVSRNYFDLGGASQGDGEPLWWRVLRWLLTPFIWLFQSMEGWPEFVRWTVVIACFVLLVVLVGHIIYTLAAAVRGPAVRRQRPYLSAHRELDPAELEREADRAGGLGDYMGAIRLLFRAAICRIDAVEKRKLRPGATNRDLLRRYRSTPIIGSLERFVETIDDKWYGEGACLETDYVSCRNEHARIREYVQQLKPAVHA
jgi:hypothetical protein